MSHFQYIDDYLLAADARGVDLESAISEIRYWLLENVGYAGTSLEADPNAKWCWSITKFYYQSIPRGIYFRHSEDKMLFRLRFNGGNGRED